MEQRSGQNTSKCLGLPLAYSNFIGFLKPAASFSVRAVSGQTILKLCQVILEPLSSGLLRNSDRFPSEATACAMSIFSRAPSHKGISRQGTGCCLFSSRVATRERRCSHSGRVSLAAMVVGPAPPARASPLHLPQHIGNLGAHSCRISIYSALFRTSFFTRLDSLRLARIGSCQVFHSRIVYADKGHSATLMDNINIQGEN